MATVTTADILQRLRARYAPPVHVKLWLHPIGYKPSQESAAPMLWGMGILALIVLAAVVN